MKSKLEALLLDVDGTLVNNEDAHRQAFNAAFSRAGLDWSWDQDLYRELLRVSGGKERIRYYIERFRPGLSPAESRAEFIPALHLSKSNLYRARLACGAMALRPGVERLVRDARSERLRLAIVTTTSLENVTALFEYSFKDAAADWFEVIAAGDAVAQKKPAPDIYKHALEKLALAPGQCIAIEDSEIGLRSALAAGLVTLVTRNHYTADHDFSGAAAVLDQLGEPGDPCHLLQGELAPGTFVDVDYLRSLHAHCLAVQQ